MNRNKVLNNTIYIIIITMIAKVLGFLKETLIGFRFGVDLSIDAFFIAIASIMLFSNFITNMISSTFIPVLIKIRKDDKNNEINHINNLINILIILSLFLILIVFINANRIILIIAKGFSKNNIQLTAELLKIGIPSIIFSSINGVLIAFLQSKNNHKVSSAIGLPSNLIYIVYLIFFYNKMGVKGLMFSALFGNMSQTLFLVLASIKNGYRYKPILDFKDKFILNTLKLSLPVILGVAINDINNIIDKTLASGLVEGSVASLNYGNKLNLLIYGIFVTAITTVIFPILSKEASRDNIEGVKSTMASGVRLILLITVPAAVGMIVLSTPIVQIAFERGAFDSVATRMTSGALKGYSLGMVSMSINMLVVRVFYSLQDTKSPMINSAIAVVLNLIFNLMLISRFDHVGLALGTSLSSIISLIILMYQLRKKIGPLGMKSYLDYLIKTGLASLVMGLVAYFSYNGVYAIFLAKYTGSILKLFNLLSLMIAVGLGVVVYAILIYAMGIREIREMVDKIKSRIKG